MYRLYVTALGSRLASPAAGRGLVNFIRIGFRVPEFMYSTVHSTMSLLTSGRGPIN